MNEGYLLYLTWVSGAMRVVAPLESVTAARMVANDHPAAAGEVWRLRGVEAPVRVLEIARRNQRDAAMGAANAA